jgi:hypothetical protein
VSRQDARLGAPSMALLLPLLLGATACTATPSATVPFVQTSEPPASAPDSSADASFSAVVIDPTLVAVFPATVGGLRVAESPDGEADASANDVLPTIASAAAAIVAVDQSTSDLVYALIVRVRPGALTDATFRDWRDSYDEGVCTSPTAVVGHAEAQIGGRTVYIGTCDNGLRTYHVWIQDAGLLISASSIGTRKLGELLMGELRP